MSSELSGIIPAVVTPLTDEERFGAAAMERLLERLYSAGVHGFYICGQTGEGLQQPLAMRREVAEVAVRCTPPACKAIVHVGAARTADAVELARHASKIGAAAISSLPPAGSYSFPEIRSYYRAIAAAADVPVLVYFFPEVSQAIASVEQILELCAIPGVVGLKFTDFDLFKLSQIRRAGYTIFNGRDEVLSAGLLMGAHGGIGSFYNLVPELFVEVYELSRASKWDEAQVVQNRINELIALTLRFPVFPAIKAMLTWSGIDCGPCIAPRRGLTPEEESELKLRLNRAGFDEALFLQPVARR
jgi:N-acetylneuraminate lyase